MELIVLVMLLLTLTVMDREWSAAKAARHKGHLRQAASHPWGWDHVR